MGGHVEGKRCANIWRCTKLSYMPIYGDVPNCHTCPYMGVYQIAIHAHIWGCTKLPYMPIYGGLPNCHTCPYVGVYQIVIYAHIWGCTKLLPLSSDDIDGQTY